MSGKYPWCAGVEQALRKTYYRGLDDWTMAEEAYANDLADHVYRRYERTLNSYVPWVGNVRPLRDMDLIEIGCGTGSSTAAFAQACRHVHAYEIDERSLEAARARTSHMGLSNVTFTRTTPEMLLPNIHDAHGGAPAILLFAVLEHMTTEERLTTLRECWSLLNPGGVLIIAETPNRLTYMDYHTSRLPFFHMLPLDLAIRYYDRSPRGDFTRTIKAEIDRHGEEGAILPLVRWGNGISYHEFELALGSDLESLLVADGDASEMRAIYPQSKAERILRDFFVEAEVRQPMAFANQIFNLVFQKPR
jgi:2-polyprenyl-3-methyl-5-hydroxy-6-metoxy-1,4-benzoquinol methylase